MAELIHAESYTSPNKQVIELSEGPLQERQTTTLDNDGVRICSDLSEKNRRSNTYYT